jgi:hypothetical protein
VTARQLRALRGVAAAFLAAIVAATAHTLAGGGAPGPALVVAVGILGSPFGITLVGRRPTVLRTTAAVITSQLLFHMAFAITSGADSSRLVSGHAHHVATSASGAGLMIPDAPMTVAHLLAAAVTVAVLYRGERLLHAIARGIRSVLARSGAVVPPQTAYVAPPADAPVVPAARVVLWDASRRGPPAFV